MPDSLPKRYPEWEPLMTWAAIIQSGSLSEAARQLGISQAAVSQRVKLLEEIFGTELLDRASRPARATAAGERLFEHVTSMLRGADEMMDGVRRISRSKLHVLRLGCTDSFAAAGGPIMVKALSSTAQNIRLWSGATDMLERSLEQRQLDATITPIEGDIADGITKVKLISEPFLLVLPASCTWKGTGTLTELSRSLPLIRYAARSWNGQSVDAYLATNGDMLERTCEFETTEPVLSMVSSGLGFTITTPLCLWLARHHIPDLRILPLTQLRRNGRPYGSLLKTFFLSYRESDLGPLAGELRSLIIQAFRQQINPDIVSALGLGAEAAITTAA